LLLELYWEPTPAVVLVGHWGVVGVLPNVYQSAKPSPEELGDDSVPMTLPTAAVVVIVGFCAW
jgi:hypothetical protein